MRLHTDTHNWRTIHEALARAKAHGQVADHVFLDVCDEHGSRKKARAYEIKLGTYTKFTGDKRRWTNSGQYGANSERSGTGMYAATYDEWGWFIAELFDADPDAVFGTYNRVDGFNADTGHKYTALVAA